MATSFIGLRRQGIHRAPFFIVLLDVFGMRIARLDHLRCVTIGMVRYRAHVLHLRILSC